jgi:hypothetical protein
VKAPRPTHLLLRSGDARSLCGLRDPYPRMLARFLPHHGRDGATVCDDCATALVLGPEGQGSLL